MGSGAMHASDLSLVLDARASTGESPTWSEGEGVLYWIDIEEPALHRFDPRTGDDRSWEMPAQIGSFALCSSGAVIAGLRTGLAKVDLASGDFELLAPPPSNPRLYRFNDGKCDAAGRFWLGTMYKPLHGARDPTGLSGPDERAKPIHVLTRAEGFRPAAARAVIANGFAWSPDHRTMYLTDTAARTIHAYDYDPATGDMSQPRVFASFEPDEGKPDGAAVDTWGHYWCALNGGGRVVRLDPDGAIERDIKLPVSRPTMCAFGGPNLDDLYITSASRGLDAQARAKEPLAGGIFRCRPGPRGQPPALFHDEAIG